MIGLEVKASCRLGGARARHVLAELAVMAGLPRAEGPPAATICYGGAAVPAGPTVVIPAEAEHVSREVAPEAWRDGEAEVPLLFRVAAPKGEVLVRTVAGAPLAVRIGRVVHLAFDVAAAADYYLQGRGEVGWPRDRSGRPDLRGAPAWRRESVGRAVVNRYARLLAEAVEAACAAAAVPVIRFRYWPGGAPFAVALSHDVDRLTAPRRGEILRSWLRPSRGGARARYGLADFLRGPYAFEAWPALREAEAAAGEASTFFFGARRRGPMDFAYDLAEVTPLIREIAAAGREVGLHSSYYTRGESAALARERGLLEGAAGAEVVGVRGHYLRLGGEPGWAGVAAAGFAYDATFGFASEAGWRAGAASPYRPFGAEAEAAYDFVEIPPAVMDGALFQYKRLPSPEAFSAAREIVDEAAACGGLCSLLWHYRSFRGGAFPEWGEVFRRVVDHALASGGRALTHSDVTSRYHLNRAIAARGPSAEGRYEILVPPGAPGDVVFDVSPGWRVTGGEVSTLPEGSFRLPAGGRSTVVVTSKR